MLREPGYDEKARAGNRMRTLLSHLLKLGSIYFTSSERVREWSYVYSPERLTAMMVLYEFLDYSAKHSENRVRREEGRGCVLPSGF